MKYFLIIILAVSIAMTQDQRAVIYVNAHGIQKIHPIDKNANIAEVIDKLDRSMTILDTLRYFSEEMELSTNFGFLAQEVALQWYSPPSDGSVKEFWWKNYQQRGASKKAIIRAWYIDHKVLDLPPSKYDAMGKMGYYLSADTSKGFSTPFVNSATDSIFYSTNKADSVFVSFDPLKSESNWRKGGIEVLLDSNKWQSIKIDSTGARFDIKNGQPIGFTLQNASLPDQGSVRLEISSKPVPLPHPSELITPFHSLKFYQTPVSPYNDYGWVVRSFDYGMYVVVSYSSPSISYNVTFPDLLQTTQSSESKKINIIVTQQGYIIPSTLLEKVELRYRTTAGPFFATLPATFDSDTFRVILPGIQSSQTVFLMATAYDKFGRRFQSAIKSITNTTSVSNDRNTEEMGYKLFQNYPNPFNPSTVISYNTYKAAHVMLKVYDLLGRNVATLVDKNMNAGNHSVIFNAAMLPSGIYFYFLHVNGFTEQRKMTLLK